MVSNTRNNKMLEILCLFLILLSLKVTRPNMVYSQERPLKYFGADMAQPGDFATLSQYHINTAIVTMNVNDRQSSWQPYFTAAEQYNINIVIWPLGGGGSCSFPYIGTDISAAYSLLDYVGGQNKFLGIINAHEPFWSCQMTVEQMTEIRRKLKDYVRNKFGREILVWNYIDNITSGVTSGEIMDVAITWTHCFGGAEGSCESAQSKINQDRSAIDSHGWTNVDLTFAMQTFGINGTNYKMPNADEMYTWGCKFLQTNALDGFFFYTWRNPAGYTQVLAQQSELWPTMTRIYNDCVNKPDQTPTPSPATGADANNDGQVNVLDFAVWVKNYGQNLSGAINGDFNNSGQVNLADFTVWINNYGKP